jgi:drug/metabolite transporter (DMT)-like permease
MRAYLTLLLSLAAIWGSSYMFIEVALDDLAPTTLMFLRLLVAAMLLLAFTAFRRGVRGGLADLRSAGLGAFALGIVNTALPFTLIAWGQEHIDSGVAAIANATVPIFIAVLAIWLLRSERATGARLVGIVLGLVGVGVLSGAQPGVNAWAVAGTLAVVLASVSYAVAALVLQRMMAGRDPITYSTATTVGATLVLLPFALVQAPATAPGWDAIGSVLALGIAGTAIGLVVYIKLINEYGSFRAGLVTYLLPVTALLYGALLLGEPVNAWMLLGLALILSGVALGSGLVRAARTRQVVEPARP